MANYFKMVGNTVRLAYFQITNVRTLANGAGIVDTQYAINTAERDAITAALTAKGITYSLSSLDQTGNTWIDGMTFTDYDAVSTALAAGSKNFICNNDVSQATALLNDMNGNTITIGAGTSWVLNTKADTTLDKFTVAIKLTTSSVANQTIEVDTVPYPLYKDSIERVAAGDIIATVANPTIIFINVDKVSGRAYTTCANMTKVWTTWYERGNAVLFSDGSVGQSNLPDSYTGPFMATSYKATDSQDSIVQILYTLDGAPGMYIRYGNIYDGGGFGMWYKVSVSEAV